MTLMALMVQTPVRRAMTSGEIIRMLVAVIVGAASALGLDAVEPDCPQLVVPAPLPCVPADAGGE